MLVSQLVPAVLELLFEELLLRVCVCLFVFAYFVVYKYRWRI